MRINHLLHTRCYYTAAPDPAKPRNFTNEMKQTLAGYQATAPGYLALEQQYQPQYTQLGLQNQQLGAFGYDQNGQHTPGSLELGAAANTFRRGSDLNDVGTFGTGVTAAQLQANPLLAQGYGALGQRMNDTPLLQTLNQQAQGALAQGGQLSPQDERALRERGNADFADRGLFGTDQSVIANVLNRDAAQRQRLGAAQQFATGVQGLNQNQNDFVGRATQIASTALADPFSVLLGRSGGAYAGGSGSGGFPQTIGTGSQLFNPSNPFANDVYNSNFNAEASNNIAQANAQNANTQTYATIAAALLSDKRIKTDIRDTGRRTADGVPIKTGRYRHDPSKKRYEFVLAQDVEKRRPDAVFTDEVSGLKAVDYGALAAPFRALRKAA